MSEPFDTTAAHPARRYNYWLGGKDNFAADRASGDAIREIFPAIVTAARANRQFLGRTVGYLAAEAGIRQFLDIGTGLPTADNTHEVAQRHDPASRVVYVDNDPLVMVHARALLTGSREGRTAYIQGDLADPDSILRHDALIETLDLSQPVGLMLVAVLHFLPDDERAYDAVQTLLNAFAPGSYLVLSHATADLLPPQVADQLKERSVLGGADFTGRTHEQVSDFFSDLDLIPPGVQVVSRWRPEPGVAVPRDHEVSVWGGVARKPS